MREIYDKLVERLYRVKTDKYLHLIAGMFISLLLMKFTPLIGKWWSALISFSIPTALSVIKEYCFDANPNKKDIYWTVAGSIIVILICLF